MSKPICDPQNPNSGDEHGKLVLKVTETAVLDQEDEFRPSAPAR